MACCIFIGTLIRMAFSRLAGNRKVSVSELASQNERKRRAHTSATRS